MTGFRARFYGTGPFTTIRLINEEPHPYKYFTKHNSLTKQHSMSLMMKNWNSTLMKARPLFGGSWNPVGVGNIINAPRVKVIANYAVAEYHKSATLLELEKTRARLLGCGPGSFSPVKDVNEANMVADFAVAEYNKRSGANLKLEKVISCDYQVVGGYKYHLILATNEGFAGAGVYTRLWENYIELTSFKEFPSSQTQPANA